MYELRYWVGFITGAVGEGSSGDGCVEREREDERNKLPEEGLVGDSREI